MNRPWLDQIRDYKSSENCWKKEKSFVVPVIGTLYVKEGAQRIVTNNLVLLNHQAKCVKIYKGTLNTFRLK